MGDECIMVVDTFLNFFIHYYFLGGSGVGCDLAFFVSFFLLLFFFLWLCLCFSFSSFFSGFVLVICLFRGLSLSVSLSAYPSICLSFGLSIYYPVSYFHSKFTNNKQKSIILKK